MNWVYSKSYFSTPVHNKAHTHTHRTRTHTLITGTVKPINTDHKGKPGQSEEEVASPSLPFCFQADKSKQKRLEIPASENDNSEKIPPQQKQMSHH